MNYSQLLLPDFFESPIPSSLANRAIIASYLFFKQPAKPYKLS
jgi:hypothetical protein